MCYRRASTPGATYCFTVVSYQRQKLFSSAATIALLRKAFRVVKTDHPFQIDAIVVLPDHLHCIWTLPPENADFSTRWRLIKSTFRRTCPPAYKRRLNTSRLNKKDQAIWQRRFIDWGRQYPITFDKDIGFE